MSLAVAWFSEKRHGWEWAACWLGGLAVVLVFYVFQLVRMKAVHKRPFWSSGLRMALRGALPSLIAGGFHGLAFRAVGKRRGGGLHVDRALRARLAGDPRVRAEVDGLARLGVCDLRRAESGDASRTSCISIREWLMRVNASRLMAIAFGGFHLVYGGLIVTTGAPRRNHGMIDFSQLDRTIHEKGRLSIMTLLASRVEPWPFQDLKAQLDMSDGNLITHLRTLEKADFISGEKLTGDGRPQTLYVLTAAGREAFVAYLGVLEQILDLGK